VQSVIYLSGRVVKNVGSLGCMLSFNANITTQSMLGDDTVWAADNGCFSQPGKYTDDGFLTWLDNMNRQGCLFAVAPDVVGDAKATLKRSLPMLPKIRALGYKAAFVGQDGATIDLPWGEFDCLFIGGTTAWKLSQAAGDLIAEGKRNNKWVHVGRVNSYSRMRVVAALGADSVDGTHIAFRPDIYTKQVKHWLEVLESQPLFNFANTSQAGKEYFLKGTGDNG
jgi:hypothetical protein